MGSIAHNCLATGRRGSVLAVFSKAIYLLTDEGELFWIATGDAPMHRRCAQIASVLPGPLAGSPFRVVDQHLIIDSGFTFNIDHSSLWNELYIASRDTLQMAELPSRINSLFANLDLSYAKGFGKLIPQILSLSNYEKHFSSSVDPILHFAQPFVLDIACACLNHQPAQISKSADALIGLGPGLTPSGDDCLGGMLFAIKILQTAYPNSKLINHVIPIEKYQSRTHLISFTLLKDLANGHAIAPLHQIVNRLLSGESLESIYPFISQLTQVGNSTGWDMLAGFLTGLLITYQNHGFSTSLRMPQSMEA